MQLPPPPTFIFNLYQQPYISKAYIASTGIQYEFINRKFVNVNKELYRKIEQLLEDILPVIANKKECCARGVQLRSDEYGQAILLSKTGAYEYKKTAEGKIEEIIPEKINDILKLFSIMRALGVQTLKQNDMLPKMAMKLYIPLFVIHSNYNGSLGGIAVQIVPLYYSRQYKQLLLSI